MGTWPGLRAWRGRCGVGASRSGPGGCGRLGFIWGGAATVALNDIVRSAPSEKPLVGRHALQLRRACDFVEMPRPASGLRDVPPESKS